MAKTPIGYVKGQDGRSLNIQKTDNGKGLVIWEDGKQDDVLVYDDLRGAQGAQGAQGASIEYQIDNKNHIFYIKRSDENDWNPVSFTGEKGEDGEKGERGPPGVNIDVDNFISFYVEDNEDAEDYGTLYVMVEDGVTSSDIGFEYDSSTGILYKVFDTNTKIALGDVRGPVTLLDNSELNTKLSNIESSINTLDSDIDSLINANLINRISQLETKIQELEAEETIQNNLLGVE